MIKKFLYPFILLFTFAGLMPVAHGSGSSIPEKDTANTRDCLAGFLHYQIPDEPLQIKFIDNSQGNITSWEWDFGDGTYSNWQNPLHTFLQEGTYSVCLTVTDFFSGCTDTYCEPIYVGEEQQFYAFFDYYINPQNPLNYQFLDLSLGDIDTWEWDFGDGTSSFLSDPNHIFSEPGEYEVCLKVEDKQTNHFDIFCDIVYVETTPDCQADFNVTQHPVIPLFFHFQNTSLGGYNWWVWDFGDGTISYEAAPTHTFPEKGIYQVCLEIYNGANQCNDWYCTAVNATGAGICHADFTYELQAPNPLSAQFTDQSVGETDFWLWDFGDGTTAYNQNPLHTYEAEGTYKTCLLITNGATGCYDSICDYVQVFEAPDCEALFEYEYVQNDSMSVQFTDLSFGMNSEWLWDFGDGNTSTLQNPVHTFSHEDSFEICLTVSSIWGPCQDTFCDTVIIDVAPACHALFDFEQNPGNLLEFNFSDASIGTIESWEWNFGDGTASDLQNPVHTYTSDGEFVVCLTIYDDWGPCEDTFCDTIFIELPQLCEADFEFTNEGENTFEFIFTDTSLGNIDAWEWDFGNGFTSEEQNPIHVYADTGNFEVCLSVFNLDSLLFCNSTICHNLTVHAPTLTCQAAFQAEVDMGVNKPNLYHFIDVSEGSPDEWLWDFGDGNFSYQQHPNHQYTEGGTYEVSLTIIAHNAWGENCEDEISQQILTPEYFDFGGMIFAGDFPINNPNHSGDTARVSLYRKIDNELLPIDTTNFTQNGYYYYLNMLAGKYLIKFNLTENSSNTMGYFPTYFGDQLLWENAQLLNIADSNNYTAHIYLNEIPTATSNGIGMIEGSVVANEAMFYGDGAQHDTEILLFDDNGNPVSYTYSDNLGSFTFIDLQLGTYNLMAESTGMLTNPYTITLTEANPNAHGIELELYENITGISESEINNTSFKFYPNPVGETLHVLISESRSEEFQLRIYDLVGQLLYSQDVRSVQSSKLVNIPMNKFTPGVYLIEVNTLNTAMYNTFKIIKK
jgi:PKD repeat protein